MEITKSFAPANLADWRNWLAKNQDREREVWLVYFKAASGKTNIDYESSVWEAFQEIAPSLQRNYILWLSDAKKPETFERRLQILVDEVMTGKPTSMH
jgi:uncharacterized protein YdeI (YjbR/CyaY-like superfamily)